MTGKSSYIDQAGKVVIDASRYEGAGSFSDGLAPVSVECQGWGFIDRTGSLVIPPRFQSTLGFSEGLAAVLLDGKWGFINRGGILVVNSQFDWVENFSEGSAVVKRSLNPRESQKIPPPASRNLISELGSITYKVEFGDLLADSETDTKDSEFLVIDLNGQVVGNLDQKNLEVNIDDARFSEGLLNVNHIGNNTKGFVNKAFEFAIPPRFSEAGSFSEGLARVAVIENGMEKLAFIDKTGSFVIPPSLNTDFDFRRNSSNFSEGLAAVSEGLNPSRTREETFVYIDRAGEIVLATEFFYAGEFRDGLATVYSAETNRWGFIDKTGKVVIPVKHNRVKDFSEGLALVGN